MRDDLEQRVRYLEKALPGLLPRIERAGNLLDGTREILRGLLILGGNPTPTEGPPPITNGCCGATGLPSSLTLRLPDGSTTGLSYTGGAWEGSVELPIPKYNAVFSFYAGGRCEAGGTQVAPSATVKFRLACVVSLRAYSLTSVHPLAPNLLSGSNRLVDRENVDVPPRFYPCGLGGGPYSFSGVAANAGNCSPFNLSFRLTNKVVPEAPYAVNSNWLVYAA